MKKILILIVIAGLISACEDELFQNIHPETDEMALAQMGEAFEMATLYQDSIEYYTDIMPDSVKAGIFDGQFHTYSNTYDMNHQIYSHLNAGDDHHHTPNPPDHKHHNTPIEMPFGEHHDEPGAGDHGHGDDHGDDGHDEEYHHTMENHLKMLELQHHHQEYHPN